MTSYWKTSETLSSQHNTGRDFDIMTSVVVECAYVDLIPAAIATFKDPSSDAHKRWKAGLELAAKATGYHTGFWAQFVEEPQTLHVQFGTS